MCECNNYCKCEDVEEKTSLTVTEIRFTQNGKTITKQDDRDIIECLKSFIKYLKTNKLTLKED